MYPIAAVVTALVASAALVETLHRPFVWVLLVLTLAAVYLAFALRGRARTIAYNASVVLVGLLALEGYYQWRERTVVCEPSLSGRHPELGYGPLPDRRVSCRRTSRGQLLYDVVYTIGPSGWRITPPPRSDPPAGCVVFLGGSFTFAQGVPDEAAMPYRFGLETAGRYRVYNVSFKGYGPHHVLAALEDGVVERAVSCVPTHVIYQAIPDHIARGAGLTSWGYRAPRYRLGPGGAVVRDGFFGDGRGRLRRALERRLRRSFLVAEVAHRTARSEAWHLELFHQIVARADRFVAERFPGAEFHVLAWDPGAPAGFVEGLEARGVAVHRMSRVLPGLDAKGRPFRIHRREGHPNADAHARIARYVADSIVRRAHAAGDTSPSRTPPPRRAASAPTAPELSGP